jgi:xanthine dehydrogenase YagS FAD-binding subunit
MQTGFSYVRVRSEEEAVERLSRPGARIHAGGTDLLGCLRDGVFAADTVVSISRLERLRGIARTDGGGLRIGALTTISEIAAHETVRADYPGLAGAAASVASPQLRNQGTLGGNLCQRPRCWYFRGEFDCAKKGGDFCFAANGENRYHAILGGGPCFIVHPSDTAPALIALGASIRLLGSDGVRELPLERFFVLPEQELRAENVLRRGEILTDVLLPAPAAGAHSSYRKVRERGAWDFALASVALALTLDSGRVSRARVVLGGVAPVPWRCEAAESAVRGERLTPEITGRAAAAASRGADPLDQNGYKLALVRAIVEESLLELV